MTTYAEHLARITKTLEPYTKQGQTIGEATQLISELGLSSLQVMEMIEHLEDDLDISIPLNILPEVQTVRDLALQLERLTSIWK